MGCSFSLCGQQKPNILLIMTDQQRWDMVSALHQNPYFSTPNIDRIVKGGFSFDNTYCANPISVPSRWSIFTGESTARFDIQNNTAPIHRKSDFLEIARTRSLGALLKQGGYMNFYAGKSHLPYGEGRTPGADKAINWQFDHITKDDREGAVKAAENFLKNYSGEKNPFFFVVSLINPHDIGSDKMIIVDDPHPENHPHLKKPAGINALTYLDKIQKLGDEYFLSDEPCVLPANFAPTDNHPQSLTFQKTYGAYSELMWKKYIWFYYRLVEQVDREIGRILDALEQSPYAENTIIVFTSDHGDMMASHRLAKKNIMYNECQKVPLVFKGPGIENKIDRTTPVCNGWDLLPTLCDIAGVSVPNHLSGVSLWNYIQGKSEVPEREYLYLEGSNAFEIIQNGRWAYILYELPGNPVVLFDLKNDPGQLRNLASDPEYVGKMTELKGILDKELKDRGLTIVEDRPYSISGLVRSKK